MHDIDRTQREYEAGNYEQEAHESSHENEQFLGKIVGGLFGEAEYEQEAEQEAEHEHFLFENFLNENESHEAEYEAEGEQEQFLGKILGGLFGEAEHEQEAEAESPLGEAQELELASEFLEVQNEAELEQFLGKLAKAAFKGVKGLVRSPGMKAVGGMLKKFGKTALPKLGQAVGGHFGGKKGAAFGSGLGKLASNLFEMEMEGLTHEDREFEVARQFVRFGSTALNKAARIGNRLPGPRAARTAITTAARTYAPGLIRHIGGCSTRRGRAYRPSASTVYTTGPAVGPAPVASSNGTFVAGQPAGRGGRWFRRGRSIVLMGA